jgi:vancomycin aglycone glucosyltransferase
MRVLLTSHGSTGDIYPVIRLGRALLEAGHSVRFASVCYFRDEIERAGLEFVRLPPDWEQGEFSEAMRLLSLAKNPMEVIRIIYTESLPYMETIITTLDAELRETDLFVSSYLFSSLCGLARLRNIPCAVTTFAHNAVPSLSLPPQGVPQLKFLSRGLRRKWNKVAWYIADRVVSRCINQVVGPTAKHFGLNAKKGFFLDPADKIIVTVSPALFEPAEQWDPRFKFTGYLRWQAEESPDLDLELKAFCDAERVPVLTFGSVNFDAAQTVMARFLKRWPKGKKIIIQSGWAGLKIEPARAEVFVVAKVSHDQLFKHASLVIHHGGAGTTASVLHAGVPHIVVPHLGDQLFFAKEMERIGVGAWLEQSKWPERLPAKVAALENCEDSIKKAEVVAAILAKEEGPKSAVSELESLVAGHEFK